LYSKNLIYLSNYDHAETAEIRSTRLLKPASGVLNPSMTASLAGIGTNITTPNAGATFVQAGLYGTAKFAENAYAFAGLSGESRSGQTREGIMH
jgi:hypothetical protein